MAIFLPIDEEWLGVPMLQRAASWRQACADKMQGDLGTPLEYIGARLINTLQHIISNNYPYQDNILYGPLIEQEALELWSSWHNDLVASIGYPRATPLSLSAVVVQEKGPRMSRGEPVEDGWVGGDGRNRIFLKVRPIGYNQQLWRPAILLMLTIADDAGGYEAGVQAPSQAWRTLQDRARSGRGRGKGGKGQGKDKGGPKR